MGALEQAGFGSGGGVMNRRKGNRAEINEAQRRQFVNSRLQALEDDGNALELDNSDDEFHIEDVLDEVGSRSPGRRRRRPLRRACG